jgi:hypothetical protein
MINATGKRYVSQYKSQTSLEYPIWEITTNFNSLISPPPFFFVVEKESLRINSAYIPQKEKPEEISRYLDKIIADYFRDGK